MAETMRDWFSEVAMRMYSGLPAASEDGNVYLDRDVRVTAAELYAACDGERCVFTRGHRILVEGDCDFSRVRIGR